LHVLSIPEKHIQRVESQGMFFDRVLVLAMASPVLLSRGDEVIVMDVIFNHLFTPFFGLITWLWLS